MTQPRLEKWSIDDLEAYDDNPRDISPAALDRLKEKMEAFGDVGVFVFNERLNALVSGHQRLKACRELGVQEVDVKVVALDQADHDTLVIALNEHDGHYDESRLATVLARLKATNPGRLELTGLPSNKVRGLLAKHRAPRIKLDAPKEPAPLDDEEPVAIEVEVGDIYDIGGHRVMCGDATNPAHLAALMDGARAQVLHTDPPRHEPVIVGNALPSLTPHLMPDAAVYVWHIDEDRRSVEGALMDAGMTPRQSIYWVKPQPTLTGDDYHPSHEPCTYANIRGQSPRRLGPAGGGGTTWHVEARSLDGDVATNLHRGVELTAGDGPTLYVTPEAPKGRKTRSIRLPEGAAALIHAKGQDTTTWEIKRDQGTIHPTQKPVALPSRAIRNHVEAGDIVLDPFLGSGSTILAAHHHDCHGYGLELDPIRCSALIQRISNEVKAEPKKVNQ